MSGTSAASVSRSGTLAALVGGAVAGLAEHGSGLVRDPFLIYDRTVLGTPDRHARSDQLGGTLRVGFAQRQIGQPGQGLGDHRRVGRGPGRRQRPGVPVAGRVQVAVGAGQVTEPGGGHGANLLGHVRRAGQLDGPDQGFAGGLGLAVQAGQVAGGVGGEGDDLGQAEPLGVGPRPRQLGPGRLALTQQPQFAHHEQAEQHLVFRAAERGGEFPGLPVVTDRGGVLAPPSFQHGQAAERDRLAPPFSDRGEDAGRGQEIRFRLGVVPAQVERGMGAQDLGYRAHPRMRVADRVVEDLRGAPGPVPGRTPRTGG